MKDHNDEGGESILVTSRKWDGNDGWGSIWGRSSARERRAYVAIMLIWFIVVICYGGYKIVTG
jgi:hypothetical protein